ncbi:hypothetical protein R3398_03795 [Rossellomorea marisflavi]|uniref:hypothetical protein n=1 Tax=Rossellomorea marisflavi TaxID=189381 RepID=UPI0025B1545A|nr:hypothetical protein [Rossellomorea marisflavi]MDW4525493.1 hypothetical protein [Rossellomorea marisflavi]WJV18066.1 hypothetical protein QU593_18330 [Rossellomorea marisflavi]
MEMEMEMEMWAIREGVGMFYLYKKSLHVKIDGLFFPQLISLTRYLIYSANTKAPIRAPGIESVRILRCQFRLCLITRPEASKEIKNVFTVNLLSVYT